MNAKSPVKQGPNVKKLIIHKMSLLMIPPGTKNGLVTGIEAIRKPGNLVSVAREATKWVEEALALVKAAPDNPWGEDDEAIAGVILEEVNKKQMRGER